jgi:pimeloyl-ACP methyl ester carboxylesterase
VAQVQAPVHPGRARQRAPRGDTAAAVPTPVPPLCRGRFTVWIVTRRGHMPAVADMANDVAQAIADELGGRVDLVAGESNGGAIALYLATRHPDC